MALTLIVILRIRLVYWAFCVSESVWFWGVWRKLRADNYVQGAEAAFVAMHNAGRGPIAPAIGLGRLPQSPGAYGDTPTTHQ
jgi:hypothetical protein